MSKAVKLHMPIAGQATAESYLVEIAGVAMESNAGLIVRALKRLKAAVGYHELGMTRHAVRCLDSLASLGKVGHLGLVADVLRDVFANHSEDHVAVHKALEIVACMLPSARRTILMVLAACYGPVNGRATNRAARARGTKIARGPRSAWPAILVLSWRFRLRQPIRSPRSRGRS